MRRTYVVFLWYIVGFMGMCAAPSYENYNYDQCLQNKSVTDNQPVAIMVIAFNRPGYLTRVIRSLEQNPESQSLPFYFFLDGGCHTKQVENEALINASTIKNKIIIKRERNYGCAKNHVDAKRYIFDWCGYSRVIILEEDLEVSRSFIHVNLALHTWAKKNFSNVGVVQCWSYCYLPKREKARRLRVVEDSRDLWWSFVGYCMDKEVWDAMKPMMFEYEAFVDQIPHTEEFDLQRSKPGSSCMAQQLRAWAEQLIKRKTPTRVAPAKELFPTNADKLIKAYVSSGNFGASQDITTGFILWIAGYIKISTVVNRAQHVGEEGITCDKPLFDKVYGTMHLDDFSAQDFKLHDFVVHE